MLSLAADCWRNNTDFVINNCSKCEVRRYVGVENLWGKDPDCNKYCYTNRLATDNEKRKIYADVFDRLACDIKRKNQIPIASTAFSLNADGKREICSATTKKAGDLLANMQDNWFARILPTGASATEIVSEFTVFNDVKWSYPYKLFWKEVWFATADDLPIPIYKYGENMVKSFDLAESDVTILFKSSWKYGKMQQNSSGVFSEDEKMKFDYFVELFGERHTFPNLNK